MIHKMKVKENLAKKVPIRLLTFKIPDFIKKKKKRQTKTKKTPKNTTESVIGNEKTCLHGWQQYK